MCGLGGLGLYEWSSRDDDGYVRERSRTKV